MGNADRKARFTLKKGKDRVTQCSDSEPDDVLCPELEPKDLESLWWTFHSDL